MKYILALLLFLTLPAMAQENVMPPGLGELIPRSQMIVCTRDYEAIKNRLETNFEETLSYVGMINETNLLQITKSTDTFTILILGADGIACIIATGKTLIKVDQKPTKKGIEN